MDLPLAKVSHQPALLCGLLDDRAADYLGHHQITDSDHRAAKTPTTIRAKSQGDFADFGGVSGSLSILALLAVVGDRANLVLWSLSDNALRRRLALGRTAVGDF